MAGRAGPASPPAEGQAARTLADAADIEARTLRSLLWRLDHGQVTLDQRPVVLLDEAGMTTDADLFRRGGMRWAVALGAVEYLPAEDGKPHYLHRYRASWFGYGSGPPCVVAAGVGQSCPRCLR